ncbi:hypothetical protein ACFYXM_35055 [Streptomyces sp. NPDC002476]|uniref:hypothetical protein n=1 Tax=Streptomyces sp. NPDC002476 TaxID=3364648 RepID=UPI0036C473C8
MGEAVSQRSDSDPDIDQKVDRGQAQAQTYMDDVIGWRQDGRECLTEVQVPCMATGLR